MIGRLCPPSYMMGAVPNGGLRSSSTFAIRVGTAPFGSEMLPTLFSTRIIPLAFCLETSKFLSASELASVNHRKFRQKSVGSFQTGFKATTNQFHNITHGGSMNEVICRDSRSVSQSFSSSDEDSPLRPSEELSQSLEPGSKIDLNLARRRLQVSFTCNACGERSQRLINPHAYARGTVFVQCAGCKAYHRLVDNLNLIDEIDYRLEDGPEQADESEI